MTLTRSEIEGIPVIACGGELALNRGDGELTSAVQQVLDVGARRIILDFRRLASMDSAGVGAVVACSKRAAERGAVLRLVVAPAGPVRKILVVTHLDRAFDVFADIEAAARGFGT